MEGTMIRTATKQSRPDPTRRYRCWMSHVSPAGQVSKGEILRGDHPTVAAAFTYWVDHELVAERDEPSAWDRIVDENEEDEQGRRDAFTAEARRNPVSLTVQLMRARSDFVTTYLGRPATIRKGSVVTATDPLAVTYPNEFEPS
jgi:hypothetical protein